MSYTITREGKLILLKDEGQKILTSIFVDATDNRLTIDSIDPSTPEEAIHDLVDYLEGIGGKQIFIVPDDLKLHFLGFTKDPALDPKSERLRETSFEKLGEIVPSAFEKSFHLVIGTDYFKHVSLDNIEKLMQTSNFLATKLEQYKLQKYAGFQLMCTYSTPIALIDSSSGEIKAYCRITHLSGNNYYLGDTFVDVDYFGDKAKGTALLYSSLANAKIFPEAARILLIVPPGRVDEFRYYGCDVPKDLITRFAAPGKALTEIFEEEVHQLSTAAVSPGKSVIEADTAAP